MSAFQAAQEALARAFGPRSDVPAGPRTDGELVYAIGDIHGCYALMKDILGQVVGDYRARARGRRPILVFLGDYVDRGPHSARVMEALVWLHGRAEADIRFLKGNHEQALLSFLEEPEAGAPWLGFGGAETLASYGVVPPDPAAGDPALVQARDELLERMPASHLRVLERLETSVTIGDCAFVHAGVRPGTALAAQTEDDLLWIRHGFVDAPGPFEKVIVHGHTWISDEPQVLPHRIGVDTGAYATGVLSAIRFDGGEVGVLQARGPSDPALAWRAAAVEPAQA